MANAVSEITDHGLAVISGRGALKVRLFRCTFDTLTTPLVVFAGTALFRQAIVGLDYVSPNAHKLIINSYTATGPTHTLRSTKEFAANSGIIKELGSPLISTSIVGEGISLACVTGLIPELLIALAEYRDIMVKF